jgi:phosphonate transport system substrate-binding protein
MAKRTHIIKRSETFGFPPIVARVGLDPGLRTRIEAALIGMNGDAEGGTLLRDLALDGFATYPADLYEPIRFLAKSGTTLRPPAEP